MFYEGALEKLKLKELIVNPHSFLESFRFIGGIGWIEGYGLSRLALSDNHIKARRELLRQLERLGARVRFDEAGNIIAEIGEGGDTIAVGSHLDSVPGGGMYDGAYGVIAGLEALKAIVSSGLKLRHKLALIDFNNEEGSRWNPPLLGSGLSTGFLTREFVYSRLDSGGTAFSDALRESGFMGDSSSNLRVSPPKYYIELHVEQGPELYEEGFDIGIPQGIVGLRVLEVKFEGRRDHASSSVERRSDALTGLAKTFLALREYALKKRGKLRITIGHVEVSPNVFNIVPGSVKFTVDIRSFDENIIREAEEKIVKVSQNVADEEGLQVSYKTLWNIERILFDRTVVDAIEEACLELEFKCKRMWSWAGHDAQNMARIAKTGMIFVPSLDGVSHSKEEYTRDEDLVKGLLTLVNTIVKLDFL